MASTASLTPSQAIRSTSGGSNNQTATSNSSTTAGSSAQPSATANAGRGNRGRQRRRNNNNKAKNQSASPAGVVGGGATDHTPSDKQGIASAQKQKARNNNNNKKKKGNNNNNNNHGKDKSEGTEQVASNGNANQQPKKKNNNNRKNKNRKRFPWRKRIPAGTVDPITLENLASLPYPPFALRAAAPYLPVPEWPPKEESQSNNNSGNQNDAKKKEEDAKERERRLLQEQWGKTAVLTNADDDDDEAKVPAQEVDAEVNPKHLNLFDGRALAYYMVSQLQFIDPLNRRDLTREELVHLDRYLARNNFTDLNVVEAYDTKGVSLSTAGAASTTAAGRMEILQQEARVLLNALFGGQGSLPAASNNSNRGNNNRNNNNNNNNNSNNSNALMQQYSNYQAAQEHENTGRPGQQYNRHSPSFFPSGEDGDEDGMGMMVVDDDEMRIRGANHEVRPYRPHQPEAASQGATLWSAVRITGPTASASNLRPQNFPALSTAAALPPTHSSMNSDAPAFVPPGATTAQAPAPAQARPAPKNKKPLPPAQSLKFITKSVKKTTPEETQRQFEAREEARRKAMLSNLTFGSNPASWNAPDIPQAAQPSWPQPSEGQLERNRVLADAFGLSASSNITRQTSWARPTNIGDNIVLYPDALILTAREKMGPLLKLERKWKAFLEDDKAASLPLNHMDRETRAFVHEYSDYWKLHTESFDPEPKRYIHCVKLMDTSQPYPLLSDAARDWRGPTGRTASSMPEHASQQTAGQDTRGRSPVMIDLSAPAAAEPLAATNPRAASLTSERPKLELKERTLPLELPPFQPTAPAVVEEESEEQLRRRHAKIEDQKRKEQEREERKQKALEAAFASDDEEESLGEVDADSDWEQGEALYSGSDDEEDF